MANPLYLRTKGLDIVNKKKWILLCIVVGILVTGIVVSALSNPARFIDGANPQRLEAALQLLRDTMDGHRTTYSDFISNHTAPHGSGYHYAQPRTEPTANTRDYLSLAHGDTAYYVIYVPQGGLYHLHVEYRVTIHTHTASVMRVRINGEYRFLEMDTIALRMAFYDESKDFPTNIFGDQSPPMSLRLTEWQQDYFHDTTFSTALPLLFQLEAGDNVIQITNIAQHTYLGTLSARAPIVLPTYAQYRAAVPAATVGTHTIPVNAVDYIGKNSADVTLFSMNSVRAYPVMADRRLINAVRFIEPGSSATYAIYAPQSGLYAIGMNVQTGWIDFETYISIRINGEIPFQEFKNFNLHGNQEFNAPNFKVLYNRDTGVPFFVYLPAGWHTLCFTLEMEPLMPAANQLRLLTDHIAQFVLDAQKIIGSGTVDATRSWHFTRYMPNTVPFLEAYETIIRAVLYDLQFRTDAGVNAEILAETVVIFNTLERLLEFPDDLPLFMQNLSGALNSVHGLSGRLFGNLNRTSVFLESLLLSTDPDALAGPGATRWDAFAHSVREVLVTFTGDRFNHRMDDEVLNIWVAQRSIMEIDLLQNLVDAHFTPQTGLSVRLSVMPDVNRLIMSAAANEVPDMAIGLPSFVAFDLASRNALHDMTQFPNFWEVAGQFPPGAMVPFAYLNGMYALPESLEFNVLAYRTDIFTSLDLPVPDTWQDVVDILPELQRFGMNFHHPMSGAHAFKFLHQTWPMFLQMGAGMFSADGTRSLLADPAGVQAFNMLGELFVRHALPLEIPSLFDAFRRAETPIAIINAGQYRTIRAARDLQGLWNIAPLPGIPQEDGTVARWYATNGHSALMFNTSERLDDAWAWLQWWLSAPVQVMYTQMLASSFGELFFWLPSNKDAWHAINLPHDHRQVVIEQLMWLQDAQRIPGLYMVERAISNAWNAIVFDGVSPQRAADRASTVVNREVRRKMIEFGFFDSEGTVQRDFILRDIYWIIENIEGAMGP